MIDSHLQKRLQDFIKTASKPLVVILGPTASGKTEISIRMAKWGNGEIVNADSRQLYKFLDIGTAKITREEMHGIPHHLLDILDPKVEVTAAEFKRLAEIAIDDIHRRKKIPLLVGGSMLYISAVIDGLDFPVPSDPYRRAALNAAYDEDGGESLYAKLMEIDPETASAFSPNNKPYVIRAMEIFEATNEKPSDLRKKSACPYDLFIIGIARPRSELTKRITERTQELFKKGWVEEVRNLLKRGYRATDPAMKSHGYREIIRYLKTGEPSEEKLQEVISARTRQYAKRQMTWWKDDERIQWITAG